MTGVRDVFDSKQLSLLKSIGVDLENEKDYSDDELLDIHDIITNKYLSFGFDSTGEPIQPICSQYESIIDTFHDSHIL